MTTFYQKIKQTVGLAASLLCLLCTQVTWLQAQAPNTWEQKSNLPPNDINGPGARSYAVGFSIGNKGYIGTGDGASGYTKDFWEYDPTTNSWTQKADFGGTARFGAVGFSIGNKGYIGTGYDQSYTLTKDFWEYDPTTNSWTQKADFGGTARYLAVGFSIGNKGYVGTGTDNGDKKDFWEYDPVGNSWAQKADFGGTNRFAAVGFSIGSKGYLGTGRRFDYDSNGNPLDIYLNDFWEYDPATNNWMQKANVGGGERAYAVGFSTSNKGYLGTGTDGVGYKNDFWEYDPAANSWIKKADAGGGERYSAVGFGIGSKGYIGTGYDASGYKKDLWEYDPSANNWTKKAEQLFADNLKRYYAVGFSIGNKGYIGTGSNTSYTHLNDFWEYDPSTNTWTQKADFAGTPRYSAVGFSIGNKGYIGTGYDNTGQHTNDFWEYDPSTNTWTKKADFGGVGRYDAVGFSIGSKGYIGTGMVDYWNYITTNDFWEYDPNSDTWTKKADFGGGERHVAVGFGIGSKGYIGTGASRTQGIMEDFWEYNPSTNSWAQKANFGGGYLGYAVGFSMGGKGYVGAGTDISYGYTKAFWEYNPVADTWTKKADFGGTARAYVVGFGIGNKGYIGTGNDYGITNDFWAYTPEIPCNLSASIAPSIIATICAGATLALSGSSTGGTAPTYSWSAGGGAFESNQQNPSFTAPSVGSATNYTITLTTSEGTCSATATVQVQVKANPTLNVTPPASQCGGTINLNTVFSSDGSLSYFTDVGFNSSTANPVSSSGPYYAKATGTNSCSATASVSITINTSANISAIPPAAAQCGGTINLSTAFSTNGSLSYFTDNAFSSSAANPVSSGGIYYAKASVGTCTATATVSVTINPVPMVSINPATAQICTGQNLLLSATTGTAYSWTKTGGGFTSTTTQTTLFSSTIVGGYSYTVKVSNGSCTASATASVTVISQPSASISPSATQTICVGATLNLIASGSGLYSWSGPGNFSSTNAIASLNTSSTSFSGVYKVTVGTGICTATATISVNIQQASVSINPNPVSVCLGETINLSSSTANAYSWRGPNGFSSSQQNINSLYTSTDQLGIYSLTVTVGNCTASTTAEVKSKAQMSAGLQGGIVCIGGTIQLTASGMNSYSWTRQASNFSSTLQNPVIPSAKLTDSGAYLVTGRSGSCTGSAMVLVLVTSPTINPEFTVSPSSIAQGAAITLSATSATGTYSWSGPAGFSGSTRSKTISSFQVANNGVYRLTLTSGLCKGYTEKTIVIGTATRLASGEREEEIGMEINAYPNPVTNILTVEVTLQKPSKLSLSLFNSIGKESGTWQLNEEATVHKTELNMSELIGGVYLLQAQAGKQKVVKRVVKIQY